MMMKPSEATKYRKNIELAAVSLPDDEAYYTPEMFPRWASNLSVSIGDRYCYQEKLYKCVQGHTTQEGWEPDKTPALWTEVPKPGEIPVWKQPTGAQDAYMTGDKVHYPTKEDPVYVSTMDYNTYAPDVYGWELTQ
jgi:hypothetical protein